MPFIILDTKESAEELQPRADIYRTPRGWVIKFDLAGVRSQDVQVKVEGPLVQVSGIRRDWIVEEGWCHYTLEISYSRFQRVIKLPRHLEGSRVATECREGMLLVHILEERDES
jgi:HSP20 family protein